MCTGTPHCGSGVQARDELLIPTTPSILTLPSLPLPPASPPRSSAVCRSLRLRRDAQRKRQRHQSALCFFRWSENSHRQRRAALAVNQDRQCQEWAGAGCLHCSGQTRSIIQETESRRRMLFKQGSDWANSFPFCVSSQNRNHRGVSVNREKCWSSAL